MGPKAHFKVQRWDVLRGLYQRSLEHTHLTNMEAQTNKLAIDIEPNHKPCGSGNQARARLV